MNIENHYRTLIIPTIVVVMLFIGYGIYNLFYVEHDASVDNLISGKTFEAISVLVSNRVDFTDTKASLDSTFSYLKDISFPTNFIPSKGRYNPFTPAQ